VCVALPNLVYSRTLAKKENPKCRKIFLKPTIDGVFCPYQGPCLARANDASPGGKGRAAGAESSGTNCVNFVCATTSWGDLFKSSAQLNCAGFVVTRAEPKNFFEQYCGAAKTPIGVSAVFGSPARGSYTSIGYFAIRGEIWLSVFRPRSPRPKIFTLCSLHLAWQML